MLIVLSKFFFWLSMFLGIIGLFITFVPGYEISWVILVTLLALPSLLMLGRNYKVVAIILIAIWGYIAIKGYFR